MPLSTRVRALDSKMARAFAIVAMMYGARYADPQGNRVRYVLVHGDKTVQAFVYHDGQVSVKVRRWYGTTITYLYQSRLIEMPSLPPVSSRPLQANDLRRF